MLGVCHAKIGWVMDEMLLIYDQIAKIMFEVALLQILQGIYHLISIHIAIIGLIYAPLASPYIISNL